ncbi:MAG: ABC transporter permease [Thermomicrobiales bacterium]
MSAQVAQTGGMSEAGRLQQSTATTDRKRRSQRVRMILWAMPIILFIGIAIFGPIIHPFDSVKVRTGDRLEAPGAVLRDGSRAWLGTDQVGRDVLAQVLEGARISLLVGVSTILFAGTIGLVLGVIAGFRGGFIDSLLMRLADIQLAFPSILLAILIAAVLGPSVANVILTLSLTRWVIFGRVARAATLAVKEREYVLAARATGVPSMRLLVRHIVPAAIPPLLVVATVEVGLVIIAEASLSFLGLGTPPGRPSWGQMVADGRAYLNNAWWIATMPGAALSLLVLSIGLFGDQVRDELDPRGRR